MTSAQRLSLIPSAKEGPLSLAPKSRKVMKTSIEMGVEVWARMEEAARTLSEEAKAEGRKGFSRQDLIEHCCLRWLEEWDAERGAKRSKK